MQRVERRSDDGVPKPREPSRVLARPGERRDVPAHGLDEHELRHARQHRVAPRLRLTRLGDDVLGEFSEPVAGDAAGDDLAWQRREQRIERAEVAAEEAADDVALGPEPRLTIAVLGNRSGVAASNCPT
jgi:hypothetical protein